MLVMEFTRRLAISLLLIAASPTAAATGTRDDIRLSPENLIILAPLNMDYIVELICEVRPGATPRWKINGHTKHPGDRDNMNITTSNNVSIIRIGDLGLRGFHPNLQGSSVLTVHCISYVGFDDGASEERLIVLFEAPGQPGNLTVSPRSGHILWGQPENMVEEVPLSYSLVVQDLANDSHTVTYENVTKQRIKIDIPECYSIELYASNEAGTSAPSILSSPPCSPAHETSAESSASTSLSRTSGSPTNETSAESSASTSLSRTSGSPTNETSAESSASTSLSRTSGLFNLAWIVAALLHTDCIP